MLGSHQKRGISSVGQTHRAILFLIWAYNLSLFCARMHLYAFWGTNTSEQHIGIAPVCANNSSQLLRQSTKARILTWVYFFFKYKNTYRMCQDAVRRASLPPLCLPQHITRHRQSKAWANLGSDFFLYSTHYMGGLRRSFFLACDCADDRGWSCTARRDSSITILTQAKCKKSFKESKALSAFCI